MAQTPGCWRCCPICSRIRMTAGSRETAALTARRACKLIMEGRRLRHLIIYPRGRPGCSRARSCAGMMRK